MGKTPISDLAEKLSGKMYKLHGEVHFFGQMIPCHKTVTGKGRRKKKKQCLKGRKSKP